MLLRYLETPPDDRTPFDLAYAEAMRKVSAQHPDDLDVQVLFAESLMDLRPWKLWTKDGKAEPGTDEILAILAGRARQESQPSRRESFLHPRGARPRPRPSGPCPVPSAWAA